MRESRSYGSVRGARDETRVPTATGPLTSGYGTFETWPVWLTMSASGGKAEVAFGGHQVRV
jgi:hypothetical protein